MRSRKRTGWLVFLLPCVLGAMAGLRPFSALSSPVTDAWVMGLAFAVGAVGGPLVDWKGSRPVIVVGGLVVALGFLSLSTSSSLGVVLTGRFLAIVGGSLASGVAIRVLVADWFVQYRGTFLGLAALGGGLGSRFGPSLADEDGWRMAARSLALAGMGIAVAGFTMLRSTPTREEADDPDKVRVPGRRSPQRERLIPAGQYVRSPGLWRALVFLALASAGIGMVSSGLSAVFRPEGFALLASFGIARTIGGVVWGVAADFWARHRLLWLSGAGSAALLMMLYFSSTGDSRLVGELLVLAGLFLGGLRFLIGLTFVDYVGVKLLGTLSLIFGLLVSLGFALGPQVTRGEVFGSSDGWFIMSVPLVVLAVLLAWRAPYPAYPAAGVERQAPRVEQSEQV